VEIMSVQDAESAASHPTIRWLRVLLAGFLAEVVLVGVAIPFYFLPDRQTALNLAIPPASFLAFVGFGWWAARGLPRSQVLNGLLAGVAGVLLYVVLVLVASVAAHRDPMTAMTPAYVMAHALKLAGGAVGGWLAARGLSRA
jgi:putative membrane protein (TIGR04086 family)